MKSFIFDYVGSNGFKAHCDVSILKNNVVVLHERADNQGQSVTNACEIIASDIAFARSYFVGVNPDTIQWFEHYDAASYKGGKHAEEWDRITFERSGFKFIRPDWHPSSFAEIQGITK